MAVIARTPGNIWTSISPSNPSRRPLNRIRLNAKAAARPHQQRGERVDRRQDQRVARPRRERPLVAAEQRPEVLQENFRGMMQAAADSPCLSGEHAAVSVLPPENANVITYNAGNSAQATMMMATTCRQPTRRAQRPNGIRSALRSPPFDCFGGVVASKAREAAAASCCAIPRASRSICSTTSSIFSCRNCSAAAVSGRRIRAGRCAKTLPLDAGDGAACRSWHRGHSSDPARNAPEGYTLGLGI